MLLHIGGEKLLRWDDIVGVFDMDNATSSHLTREFLKKAERAKKVTSVSEELPKSFILCGDRVYLSHLGSATLLGRTENLQQMF